MAILVAWDTLGASWSLAYSRGEKTLSTRFQIRTAAFGDGFCSG